MFSYFIILFFFASAITTTLTSCNSPVTTDEKTKLIAAATSTDLKFAGGTKAVRINFKIAPYTKPSFDSSFTTPISTIIPSTYPGADGASMYNPGISPITYYDLDGTTAISKPDWLLDFQLGVNATQGAATCATFGQAGALDVANTFRVSETDCSGAVAGTGESDDTIFFRMILDRTTTKIGSAENLMIQVEYQASGLHYNTWGTGTSIEDKQEQLWKIFWNSSLLTSVTPTPLSLFVPPHFSACKQGGIGDAGDQADGVDNTKNTCMGTGYSGAPVKTRQFIIPLSAYSSMSVIQFSRIWSKILETVSDDDVVNAYCATSDSPLCFGVVIHSVSLIRI